MTEFDITGSEIDNAMHRCPHATTILAFCSQMMLTS